MSETLQKMTEKFKPFQVPALLADLCRYWDKNPVFFSASFEVDYDQYEGVKAWFRGNTKGPDQIRMFGKDGIDSLYCLWFYEGRTADNAPVVYLGGEGEGTTILANDMSDFMSILAANREWEPFDKEFMDEEDSNTDENLAFRKWLKDKHKILPAKDPLALMKKAKKNHPDFQKWLNTVKPVKR